MTRADIELIVHSLSPVLKEALGRLEAEDRAVKQRVDELKDENRLLVRRLEVLEKALTLVQRRAAA
jgi:hypothetical protein